MTADNGSMIGMPAPDFELADTEGNLHRLADYTDRWLLIVFHRHLA
jgi:peroxiredoxin